MRESEAKKDERTAILEIGEGWRAGKLKDNEPEVLAYRAWLADKLSTGGKDVKTPVESHTKQTSTTAQRGDDKSGIESVDWEQWLEEKIPLTGIVDEKWIGWLEKNFGVDMAGVITLDEAVNRLDGDLKMKFIAKVESKIKKEEGK